jgi:[ribosomal protein S5]-alanine N-acetyltransferase
VIAAAAPPELRTPRLRLRPLRPADAAPVTALLADARVSQYLVSVPFPYPAGTAAGWIRGTQAGWSAGTAAHFAILRAPAGGRGRGRLIGSVGLRLVPRHRRGELGYWLGAAHWGQGYATEAARAVVRWGFTALALRRIHAQYLGDNHASGRVLEAIGMRREGVRRQHLRKAGQWYDAHQFGILREEIPWPTRS